MKIIGLGGESIIYEVKIKNKIYSLKRMKITKDDAILFTNIFNNNFF